MPSMPVDIEKEGQQSRFAKARHIDNWSFYDYKEDYGTRFAGPPKVGQSLAWQGDHWRRLDAYRLLDAYCRNVARYWLMKSPLSLHELETRREYGDPNTIVRTIKNSLLGNGWSITVRGAQEGEHKEQLQKLQDWADDDNFMLKVIEGETNSVKLGDNVYVLAWDDERNRPCMEVYDPGAYFPVLDASDPSFEYPKKIHIAYEWEEGHADDQRYGEGKFFVRRMTWELVELDEFDPPEPQRDYPWNSKPSNYTVLFTDATWALQDVRGNIEDLDESKATFASFPTDDDPEGVANQVDLHLDWIPVVHIPNTVAGAEHYGTSSLAVVLQILDDLVATDTDLQAASATTGSPPLIVHGARLERDERGNISTYGPGQVLEVGEGGGDLIDTSKSLDALMKYSDSLLERLSVNSQIPESLMGRVKPSEVPSGIALALSFAPHTSLITEMRLVRAWKYRILLKMVYRLFMQNGDVPDSSDIGVAELNFGPFLPADKKAAMDIVVQGLSTNPPSISLETAVGILVMAGFDVDDAEQEVKRIVERWYQGLTEFITAGGTVDESRGMMDLEPLPEPTLPPLGTPPGPGGPGKGMIPDPNNPGRFIPEPGGPPQPPPQG